MRDGEIIELRRRQRVGGDLQHGHRHRGRFEPHDHGRRNIGRQRFDDRLRNRRDFGLGAGEVDSVLKKDIDDADAVVGVA